MAFAVCTALDRAGITAVLTGGSAATYYAPNAYQSLDIDFVIALHRSESGGHEALVGLGYRRENDCYIHPDSPFPLEFPRGPLMVGDELLESWSTETRKGELLHVLTPTDCCRDRLAAFLFWNDFSGLEQALAVCMARATDIDLALVRTWCERERQPDKFRLFAARLHRAGWQGSLLDY